MAAAIFLFFIDFKGSMCLALCFFSRVPYYKDVLIKIGVFVWEGLSVSPCNNFCIRFRGGPP